MSIELISCKTAMGVDYKRLSQAFRRMARCLNARVCIVFPNPGFQMNNVLIAPCGKRIGFFKQNMRRNPKSARYGGEGDANIGGRCR